MWQRLVRSEVVHTMVTNMNKESNNKRGEIDFLRTLVKSKVMEIVDNHKEELLSKGIEPVVNNAFCSFGVFGGFEIGRFDAWRDNWFDFVPCGAILHGKCQDYRDIKWCVRQRRRGLSKFFKELERESQKVWDKNYE